MTLQATPKCSSQVTTTHCLLQRETTGGKLLSLVLLACPGVLHLSMDATKEGHELFGPSPNKDHNDRRAGIPLLRGKIEREYT